MITLVMAPARLVGTGGRLELHGQSADPLLERQQDRLAVAEQFLHPLRHAERGKVASLPPALHRLDSVIDHQTAPLGFELFARFDQLLALPMNGSKLFLRLAWDPHQRQRRTIAFHKAIQFQAECLGIEPVGFHPPVLLIPLLRADHLTRNPQ
jgi:hypothetical protein